MEGEDMRKGMKSKGSDKISDKSKWTMAAREQQQHTVEFLKMKWRSKNKLIGRTNRKHKIRW